MKKMKKVLTIFLMMLFCLFMAIAFVACGGKTKEECIPKTLGVAEGLYVYYDNYRSFTDGAQTERLLNEISVDDVIYTAEEYEIQSLEYMPNQKEIFYGLKAQKADGKTKNLVWHYNYDTKENGLLHAFEANNIYETIVQTSETYLYAYCYNGGGLPLEGALFDQNLNLITEGFDEKEYRLQDDCVYDRNPYGAFHWWKNGQFRSVETLNKEVSDVFIADNYAYVIYENMVFLIDMNTGNYRSHTFEGEEKINDSTSWRSHFYATEKDTCYVITSSQTTLTNSEYFGLKTGCKLYRLQGLELTCLYTFNSNYEVRFITFSERYLNFEMERFETYVILQDRVKNYSAYYDLEENKFVMNKKQKVQSIDTEHKRLTVGKYEFYTDKVEYGGRSMWDASHHCYYLHRIKDGKDEIMQYYFDEGNSLNPILFNDICEK